MARRRPVPPAGFTDTSYRRYSIRHTITGQVFVEKDGYLIAWAKSVEDARRKIEELAE